jgi:hypothetical protein
VEYPTGIKAQALAGNLVATLREIVLRGMI